MAAALLAAPVAAFALPDLGAEQDRAADTPYAPVPQEKDPQGKMLWTRVGGARFARGKIPDPGYPSGSPTPTEVDFHDVALKDASLAYAVGSLAVEEGRRVPVIYRYRRDARGDEFWEEVYRSPEDQPGYVARVVWADRNTVLAVGGDGKYPYREKPDGSGYCAPGESNPAAQDDAGMGRVWVLRAGEPWRELTDAEMPDHVRALTALDSYYAAEPDSKQSFAVAGGLCQLWHFEDGEFLRAEGGEFAAPYDTTNVNSPAAPPGQGLAVATETWKQAQVRPEFRLRVRDIRFADAPQVPAQYRVLRAAAATSGCCVPGVDQQLVNPLDLVYTPPPAGEDLASGTWRIARELLTETASPSDAAPTGLPDSAFAMKYTQVSPTQTNTGAADWYRAHLFTPARERDPELDRQPPSTWAEVLAEDTIVHPFNMDASLAEFPVHAASSMRLVDADGNADVTRSPLDWSVGSLDSTGQAVILSTNAEQVPPWRLSATCENGVGPDCLNPTQAAEHVRDTQRSYQLLGLPLYALNGVDVWDEEGVGWAVGRYGAIARYGEDRSSAGNIEPDPPELSPAEEASLPGADLYEPFRAIAAPRGEVPALATQPRERLDRPRLFPAAAVGADVNKIVMSDDGSEGWAIVGSGNGAQIYRYRDAEWRPCHPEAIDTRFAADPACSALPAKAIEFFVPIPSDDGHFRAAAYARVPNRLFFYDDGRWRPGEHPIPQTGVFDDPFMDVIFTGPDEAWVYTVVNQDHSLVRYDAAKKGQEWFDCTEPAPLGQSARRLAGRCGDVDGLLDFRFMWPGAEVPDALKSLASGLTLAMPSPKIEGGVAVGGRPYFYGWRLSRQGFRYPWIVFFDGEKWSNDPEHGGLDPGCPTIANRVCADPEQVRPDELGQVTSVALDSSDGFAGWAFGTFGDDHPRPAHVDRLGVVPPPRRSAARFNDGQWEPLPREGALREYATPAQVAATLHGGELVVGRNERLLRFDPRRNRFELVEAGRRSMSWFQSQPDGRITAFAPAAAEAWAGVENHLFLYTDRPRREVFEEASHPIRDVAVTATAAAPDGSVWVTTASERVYRRDPLTGWDSIRIPGWDPGRVVTVRSPAHAIAFGAGGQGVIVGPGGRIARIDGSRVRLDAASGTLCDHASPSPPCGTGRTLRAAAVAPDGSALVAGDNRTLLWRPAGEEFRAVATPAVPRPVGFTAISMPAVDRAWIGTSDGRIFAGSLTAEGWEWRDEARDEENRRVMMGRSLLPSPVSAIGVRDDGTGVAVGERGVIAERAATGIWQRADSGITLDLQSLAVTDDAAVAGGEAGVVLTRTGGAWRLARAPKWPQVDRGSPEGTTVGVVLTPGPGGLEAWAVGRSAALNRVWKYSPEAAHEEPEAQALRALPDVAARRDGEVAFAAWGKTECHNREEFAAFCREMNATDSYYETISRRIVRAIADTASRGEVDAAVFTGDAVDSATHQGNRVTGEPAAVPLDLVPINGKRKFSRWRELVADRLEDENVPFLVGIGAQDLANTQACAVQCVSTSRFAPAGENFVWRDAMYGRLGSGAPDAQAFERGELRFRQLGIGELSRRLDDQHVPGAEEPVPAGGGADTHFAIEVEHSGSEKPLARVVFADTSLRSLSASDPVQQPVEPDGGQRTWLERMLCFAPQRTSSGEACTRRPGQAAVVVTNTPTYTYYAGALATQPDGAAFEELMLRYEVSAVVSGRIGWNGLYWTIAPSLHSPCPGGSYPSGPPSASNPCGSGGSGTGAPIAGTEPLASAIGGTGAPSPDDAPPPPVPLDDAPVVPGQAGQPVPFVVSSGGGGKFASEADADASAQRGFWHGFSVVRVAASGNPGETIVEQRPIYDFVTIEAQERRLRPGQRMTLRGWGRGPVGYREHTNTYEARWDRIDGPEVTHRYDLLLADPQAPNLPLEDANGDYVAVPASIATVDRDTGQVRARRGSTERTYAIAVLSVGEHAAGYPLVFEPRRGFVPQRARISLPPLPRAARAPAAQPPVRLAETAPPPPAQPPASPASPLSSQTLQPPQPPQVPSLPPVQSLQVPQAPAPPSIGAPPAPPPPPATPPPQQPQPLALGAKLQAVAIVPSVNPPAPPPVNPAPPAGSAARKEAKQRQAATAKSEEGAGEGAGESTGDLVQSSKTPNGVEMTRRTPDAATSRARDRPAQSFSPLAVREQPSAWARGALYGGGLGLAALAFSAAWLIGRPRTRRRTPDVPAPAWNRAGPR